MNNKIIKNNSGFTHTPTLASLSSVFVKIREYIVNMKKIFYLIFFQRSNKKTMPKLVSGFTLVEMMIYVALMTVITLIVVQSLIVVLKSNRTSFAEINLRNAGYSAMEGMLREIYASDSITTASGILILNQSNPTNIVRFATSSVSTLNLYNGDGTLLVGPLTSKNIVVKSLIFTKINTGKSYAVKIKMELETMVNGITKTENFQSTAILRGSY